MGTVTFYRTYFLEDGIVDGDYGIDAETFTERIEGLNARDAADLIIAAGLTFAATGGSWAADPDGSYITNYGTGERCEVSAHLDGFPTRVASAVASVVDAT